MHRTRESATGPSGRFDPARVGRATALALAVLVAHAWLLRDASNPVGAGTIPATASALTVRQIPVDPPAAPTMAQAPTLETPPASARGGPIRRGSRAAPVAPNGAMRGVLVEQRTESASVPGQPMDQAARATDSAAAGESQRGAVVELIAPPPVYATRVPSSTELRFSLRRGTATGEALLSWRVDADRYELQLHATLPSGANLEQRSQGGFDPAGLAPVRLADRRRGRDQRAANFQRERGLITFSGSRWELPMVAGAQDRLTWLVQLAAIAAGAPQGLREGGEVSMLVVGARGAASLWRFQVQSMQTVSWSQGASDALLLLREPQHPYDLRIEVWLDPARNFWPLRLRQTQIPGGEATEWQLSEEPRQGSGT